MKESYTEEYKHLYHGTTEKYAAAIIKSQNFTPSPNGWCGYGVYFYDIRAKAWWSANRTCSTKENANSAVIVADIQPLNRVCILDLRSAKDLRKFADFVDYSLANADFDVDSSLDNFDRTAAKRAILLDLYCETNNIKMIIGYFQQKRTSDCEAFADVWQLAIGVETIYCVKDSTLIYNIRRR